MDLKYFYDEICDELCGAKKYIVLAIELKAMTASWSKQLAEMSAQELDHASRLYNMAMEYYNRIIDPYSTKIPEYIEGCKDDIVKIYTEKTAKVQLMHKMYKEQ